MGRLGLPLSVLLPLVGMLSVATAHGADQDRIRLAVDRLLVLQLPSGLFSYDFDFLAGKPTAKDHIARQTGTAYFLGEYYLHTRDERVRRAIGSALERFGAMSLPTSKSTAQSVLERVGLLSVPLGRRTLESALDRLGLLYRPTGEGRLVSSDTEYGNAFAGATALALLAELHYYRASGDGRFGPLRSAWLNGLLSLYVPGRGFRTTPRVLEQSPFFDGEAWLAVAYYRAVVPGDAGVDPVLRALDGYLMRRYAEEVSTGFYQWGTMAAAVRFEATRDRRFLGFIAEQARRLLAAPRPERPREYNTCFVVEGLAAAAITLAAHGDADADLIRRIRDRISEEMDHNRRLQIPPNQSRLDLGAVTFLSSPRLQDFSGAFLEGPSRPYTRIDYTGHCLSAMLKLHRRDS